jgi:glutathione S-transferase
MMILYGGPISPFVRKVQIAAALLGLSDRIQLEEPARLPHDASGGLRTDYAVTQHNPLGKQPTLTLGPDMTLYDSRVIVEFLDQQGGNLLFPRNSARWPVLTQMALADGIVDAALLVRYEHTLRPTETWSQVWIDSQLGKMERGVAALEANPPVLTSPPDIGQISVACALGYLDLRYQAKWRATSPKLVAWLDAFAKAVPAFAATTPKG